MMGPATLRHLHEQGETAFHSLLPELAAFRLAGQDIGPVAAVLQVSVHLVSWSVANRFNIHDQVLAKRAN